MAKPPALGGELTIAANAEQLYASGHSTCFNSALELVLEQDKVDKFYRKMVFITNIASALVRKGYAPDSSPLIDILYWHPNVSSFIYSFFFF